MPPLLTHEPMAMLKRVADEIWIADGAVIYLRYLGLHIPFTTRMTRVRLADGALWVHSPIAPTPGLRREVDSLGSVRCLVAPNTIHYAFLTGWREAYRAALGYGVGT